MHPEVESKIKEEAKSRLVQLLFYPPYVKALEKEDISIDDVRLQAIYSCFRDYRMECYWETSEKRVLEGEELGKVTIQNEEDAKRLVSELYKCSINNISDRLDRFNSKVKNYIEEHRKKLYRKKSFHEHYIH